MLHTILTATANTPTTNWFLIIGLTILIALPFISSTIIIPILIAFHKHHGKKTSNKHKAKGLSHKKGK